MTKTNTTLIIVGMSGGVDSSVAALLLQQQGFNVAGLFMKNWEEDDTATECTATEDLEYAKRACEVLNIPLHTVNFAAEYWDSVFQHFLAEYRAFRTPNPDILCNSEIKFKVFLEYATMLGASHIATGHYARVSTTIYDPITTKPTYILSKSRDQNKDQSYFLHTLNQQQLQHAIFPISELTKPEVRKIALAANLPNHQKKDSTGICFIGERKFKNFLQRYLPAQPGNIVTIDGKKLGEHDGLMYYTFGQRQGLNIGGIRASANAPWYVAGKNIPNNELIVVQGIDHPALFTSSLVATNLSWIQGPPKLESFSCMAKVRYRQTDQPCLVKLLADGSSTNSCIVSFSTPQRAVTPGQSVVFYQGDVCLGGGIIEHAT